MTAMKSITTKLHISKIKKKVAARVCVKEYVCILFKTEANLLDTVIIFLLVSLTAGTAASPQTGMKGETTSTDDKIGMCPSKSKSEWWTFCYFNYHVKKLIALAAPVESPNQ